jgi:hypothetical protein
MKKFIFILTVCLLGGIFTVDAQTYVKGYYRKNGTYVQSHYRSDRNHTNHDNYSAVGNTNPFTGSVGRVPRDYTPQAYSYGSGQTIHTGPRGGQYYINSNGNKTYVPKRSSSSNTYSYGNSGVVFKPTKF